MTSHQDAPDLILLALLKTEWVTAFSGHAS
jgi:hypothetical protein